MNDEHDNEATAVAATEEPAKIRMTRPEAISVLAKLAQKRDTTLEEVVAIQIAVRNVCKRIFDRERNFKRKHGADAAGIPPKFFTPPAALDAIMANPPLGEAGDKPAN